MAKEYSKKTLLMVQSGNFQLSDEQQKKEGKKAVILLGLSKIGKTTSLHYMMGDILIANKVDGILVWDLKIGKEQLKGAAIGRNQRQSQTQIPNVYNIKKQNLTIVDLPGFMDSYGCYRSISNRFFIKKIFSEYNQTKFIIVTTENDMDKLAPQFVLTIKGFFNMFEDFEKTIKQVISHTSILITHVSYDQNKKLKTVEFLKQRLQNLKDTLKFQTKYQQSFQLLLKSVIDGNRIFMIGRPLEEKQQKVDNQNLLLQQINKKIPKFWARKIDETTGKADMTKIRVTVNDYYNSDNKKFVEELVDFSNYIQFNYKVWYKQGIVKYITDLITDFNQKQGSNTKQFVQKSLKLWKQIKEYYQKDDDLKDLFKKYEKRREIIAKQFYRDKQDKSKSINSKDYPFALMKMSYLIKLYKISEKSNIDADKEEQSTRKNLQFFKEILILITDLVAKDNQSNLAEFKKFISFIWTNFDIVEEIWRIFNKTCTQIVKQELKNGIVSQIPKNLKSLLQFFPYLPIYDVISKYISDLDVLEMYEENYTTYQKYKDFIFQYKNDLGRLTLQELLDKEITQEKKSQWMKAFEQKELDLNNKIIQFKINTKDKNFNLSTIIEQLKILQQKIESQETDLASNDYDVHLSKKIALAYLLAKYYEFNNNKDQAQQVYQSLNDAYQVLRILQSKQNQVQVNWKQKKSKQQLLNILISYMRKAYKYGRVTLAIQKAQRAYSLAQSIGDLKRTEQIGTFLFKVIPSPSQRLSQYGLPDDEKGLIKDANRYHEFVANGINKVYIPQIKKELQSSRKRQQKEQNKMQRQVSQKNIKI